MMHAVAACASATPGTLLENALHHSVTLLTPPRPCSRPRSQNRNVILADEMGLGKTVQCVSFLGLLAQAAGVRGPFLVVVPLSTVPNWIREFRKWVPQVRRRRRQPRAAAQGWRWASAPACASALSMPQLRGCSRVIGARALPPRCRARMRASHA